MPNVNSSAVGLPDELMQPVAQRLAALRVDAAEGLLDALRDVHIEATLPLVWAASEFVANACTRSPGLLPYLKEKGRLLEIADEAFLCRDLDAHTSSAGSEPELQAALRQFRQRHLVRIAWRDIAGWAGLDETLADLSNLADVCVRFACERASVSLIERYGEPRGRDSGELQQLVILGMGKLGGRELNYSSDIDLIFLYPEEGETAAEVGTDNAEFFLRLGQRVIQWLANTTADGFVFRVDMRLRPFGESGPLAVSFDSFENYLQQHGRDWERYAFVKARPITGVDHYQALYQHVLRPFVYRRYLDFSVFESLRDMKQMIAREVERRELHDNIKLGPGGIREIEFIVQAFQLLRGGSARHLQGRELQTVLPRLVGQKLLTQQAVDELLAAYRFLRTVENRLQEWNDAATHRLPAEPTARLRLAVSLGYPDWQSFNAELAAYRARVSRHFEEIVFGPVGETAERDRALDGFLDPGISDTERHRAVAALGIREPEQITKQILQVRDSGYYRKLDAAGRERLHALVPRVLRMLGKESDQEAVFTRILRVIELIGGRTVYLALLNENAAALERLVYLCARSQFLAEQIAAFPLLLDELIDARLLEDLPDRRQMADDLAQRMEHVENEDEERQIEALREYQRIALFRIAVADLTGRLPLMKVSDRLTDLAELIVQRALDLAWRQLIAKHGRPHCGAREDALRPAGVVVVAYGKLGGIELGYGSDLDLVFLHDSSGEVQHTDGQQPLENTVFFARLGQRLVHLLTVHTRAGRLYEVDIRLRPSGKGGLLVQSLESFNEYQHKEAWTWEHQALLRARAVAGDPHLVQAFEDIRIAVLRKAVRRDPLQEEVRKMRERMRSELSKAKAGQFDLKQDSGGIADIEFLVQYWMLKWADDYPPIIIYSDNIRQLESLASGDIVPQSEVDFLTAVYRKYRERMHRLSLAGESDVIDGGEFLEERRRVVEIWNKAMNSEIPTVGT